MRPRVEGEVRVKNCLEFGMVPIEKEDILSPEGTLDVFPSVSSKNIFSVDFSGNVLRLQAGGFVGIVPINDRLTLRISPRTPIANLTRMVERSGHQALPLTALRTYAVTTEPTKWALDIYADALIEQCAEILNRGLLRTYQFKHGEGSKPRGRLDIASTARKFAARGISNRASFSWFERTIDNDANRCLKAALTLLHQRFAKERRGAPDSQRRVRRIASLLHTFAPVADDPERRFLSDPLVAGLSVPPATRSYYQAPLHLAAAIVAGKGISLDNEAGEVLLPSVLLNMGDLFEAYVRVTLQGRASSAGWPYEVLDGNSLGHLPLYQDTHPRMIAGVPYAAAASVVRNPPKATPDIIFRGPDGSTPLIAELKNTLQKELPERSEVEQAVTYAVRYSTKNVLLVHPRSEGKGSGLRLVGTIGEISVFDYRYDLAAGDLDREDERFAEQVALLLRITE